MFRGLAAFLLVCVASPAFAQGAASSGITAAVDVLNLPEGFDGAAPPRLPETVSRDGNGRTTVRAIRLTAPLRLDGNLDEDLYRTTTPISDFIQSEPERGAAATEKTEVWIAFDDQNIYVSMRASESQPERMIVNEMRRDSFSIAQNENFQFAFDY